MIDIQRAKLWRDFWDFPSGVVLTLFTLVMMILCVWSFKVDRAINPSILSVYGTVLGLFAYNKTKRHMKTLDKLNPPEEAKPNA